jgi:hypothetical protein
LAIKPLLNLYDNGIERGKFLTRIGFVKSKAFAPGGAALPRVFAEALRCGPPWDKASGMALIQDLQQDRSAKLPSPIAIEPEGDS